MSQAPLQTVFPEPRSSFFGFYARFAIRVAGWFVRPYRWTGTLADGPAVYVGRHADLRGPFMAALSFPADAHPMVLHVFTDKELCRKQYEDYTFTVRQGKKGRKFLCWLASRLIVPLVHSFRPVPVYRDERKAILTLRAALRCLLAGDNVAVWPDVDYTKRTGEVEEIYQGFLLLGEMYLQKTGKQLPFIPLVFDPEAGEMSTGTAVYVNRYRQDVQRASAELAKAISGPVR